MKDSILERTLDDMIQTVCECACGGYCVTGAGCPKFFGVPNVENQAAISRGSIRGHTPYGGSNG